LEGAGNCRFEALDRAYRNGQAGKEGCRDARGIAGLMIGCKWIGRCQGSDDLEVCGDGL
jgi:hypothetical protein